MIFHLIQFLTDFIQLLYNYTLSIMIDSLLSHFYNDEIGEIFTFNCALVAMSLLFILFVINVAMKLIRPALRRYNISKTLENIAKNPKHHWFYGHMNVVSLCSMLHRTNPNIFN